MMTLVFSAEIQRLRVDMESAAERAVHQKESLQQKMTAKDNEHQVALRQAKQAHEDDIVRHTQIKVSRCDRLHLAGKSCKKWPKRAISC